MRALIAIFWTLIFLLLFWIALKNADPVTLRLTTGTDVTAPLIIVLLLAFASGLILGMLAASPRLFRQGRELKRLKKTVSLHAAKNSDTGSVSQSASSLPPY